MLKGIFIHQLRPATYEYLYNRWIVVKRVHDATTDLIDALPFPPSATPCSQSTITPSILRYHSDTALWIEWQANAAYRSWGLGVGGAGGGGEEVGL